MNKNAFPWWLLFQNRADTATDDYYLDFCDVRKTVIARPLRKWRKLSLVVFYKMVDSTWLIWKDASSVFAAMGWTLFQAQTLDKWSHIQNKNKITIAPFGAKYLCFFSNLKSHAVKGLQLITAQFWNSVLKALLDYNRHDPSVTNLINFHALCREISRYLPCLVVCLLCWARLYYASSAICAYCVEGEAYNTHFIMCLCWMKHLLFQIASYACCVEWDIYIYYANFFGCSLCSVRRLLC